MMETVGATPIASWLGRGLYWVFLGIMVLNLTQRKYQERVHRKRFATLFIGLMVFALYIGAKSIEVYSGRDWMLLPVIAAMFAIGYRFQDRVWPFRFRCPDTGRRLEMNEILYDDDPCREKTADDTTSAPVEESDVSEEE